MPAESKKQRKLAAMAEHNPSAIRSENRSILSMKKSDLHDYASTKEKGLPERKKKRKRPSRGMNRSRY